VAVEVWVAESVGVHGIRVLDFSVAVEATDLGLNGVDLAPKAGLVHAVFDVVEIVAAAVFGNVGSDAIDV
jgi:hypothetical protein